MALSAALLCAQFHLFLIILVPFILLSAYQSIHRYCLRTSKQAIVYYQMISKDRWLLKTRAGKTIMGRPTVHAFRSRLFVKISFQTYPLKRRIELLVAFDAIKPEQFTHLVSRLWDQE